MAIQSISTSIVSRGLPWQAQKDAYLERSLLEKKYWDDLLEKLRKMGGGGGSDPRFDRIAVSMQLMNFLGDKQIQAMVQNFAKEFLKTLDNFSIKLSSVNQNIFVSWFQKIGNVIFNGLPNIISLITRRDAPTGRLYNATNHFLSIISVIAFQLNKLKEILGEDLKELVRKLDVKSKMKRIKQALLDFFLEIPAFHIVYSLFGIHKN